MKKEIKEKIEEILREYADASTNMLSEGISKKKLDACLEIDEEYADQILSLFEEEKKKWVGTAEIIKVKQDKRFVYYRCCGQVIGIAKKFPKEIHIGSILCGKCGRRIY